MATVTTKITFAEGAAAATPAAGRVVQYAKADGLFYSKDDAGVETPLGGGSSDLDAIITASSGQDIADALSGAAAPDSGNVFATMADVGGGGGVSPSWLGYNTQGGSWETLTAGRYFCKAFTPGANGILTSISVYLRPSIDNVDGMYVTVCADNAGAPGVMIGAGGIATNNLYLSNSGSMPGAGRWLSMGCGDVELVSGTQYWMCFVTSNGRLDVAYDGSGTDQYWTLPAAVFAVGAYPSAYAITTGTRKYSIRGNFWS